MSDQWTLKQAPELMPFGRGGEIAFTATAYDLAEVSAQATQEARKLFEQSFRPKVEALPELAAYRDLAARREEASIALERARQAVGQAKLDRRAALTTLSGGDLAKQLAGLQQAEQAGQAEADQLEAGVRILDGELEQAGEAMRSAVARATEQAVAEAGQEITRQEQDPFHVG